MLEIKQEADGSITLQERLWDPKEEKHFYKLHKNVFSGIQAMVIIELLSKVESLETQVLDLN